MRYIMKESVYQGKRAMTYPNVRCNLSLRTRAIGANRRVTTLDITKQVLVDFLLGETKYVSTNKGHLRGWVHHQLLFESV